MMVPTPAPSECPQMISSYVSLSAITCATTSCTGFPGLAMAEARAYMPAWTWYSDSASSSVGELGREVDADADAARVADTGLNGATSHAKSYVIFT